MKQFACTLTERDYMDFNQYTLSHMAVYKRSLLFLRLLVPLGLLALFIISVVRRPDLALGSGVFYALIAIVWFFAVKPLYKLTMRLTVKSQLKHGDSLYAPEFTLVFNADHMLEITPQEESKISYDKIVRIAENRGAVYIYTTSVSGIPITAPVFSSDDQREELIRFLQSKRSDLKVEADEK